MPIWIPKITWWAILKTALLERLNQLAKDRGLTKGQVVKLAILDLLPRWEIERRFELMDAVQ